MDLVQDRGWIGGRVFDLVVFFGGSALAVVVGLALLARPAWTVAAWWGFTLLADGPHLVVTLARSYLDPKDRARLGRLLYIVPLWVLVGPLSLLVSKIIGSYGPWQLFLFVALMWSYYHAIRQHYGVMAIYARHDGVDAKTAKFDGFFLQAALWLITALFIFTHPTTRANVGRPAALALPERVVVGVVLAAMIGVGLVWIVRWAGRARRGASLRPALFLAGPVVGLHAFNLFVVGQREPLVPNAPTPELAFLAVATVGGMVHGIQYVGIVAATNRRRYADKGDGFTARLGRAPVLLYVGAVVISVVAYGLLNGARGAPSLAFFGFETDAARLFLGIYWGLFFAHYHLDQHIWHPSRDPGLREDLGLVAPKASA